MVEGKALPTIWDVPDDLWEQIEPVILELDPPKAKGRKRADQRRMLEDYLSDAKQLPVEPFAQGVSTLIWVGCG